ncbi:MAG: DUF302 domain-containing protein [Hyphomicrobiaceae bacterium]
MSRFIPSFLAGLFTAIVIAAAAPIGSASAADVEKRGDAFVIYLPGNLEFFEVFNRLQSEILAANWQITNVQDIDVGMTQYGLTIKNKVISACKSQLLAKAIQEDPFISLAVPCRFTVFSDASSGKIVVGFHDPAAEAKALGIKNYAAAGQATEELKAVLKTMADFYAQ